MNYSKFLAMVAVVLFLMSACQSADSKVDQAKPNLVETGGGQKSGNRLAAGQYSSGLGSVNLKMTGISPDYEINIQTPALQDSSLPHAADFGKAITATIQAEVEAFKASLQDIASPADAIGNYLDLKYELVSRSERYYSLLIKTSAYTQGAAHPSNRIIAFNYDLQAGKGMELGQLFTPGSGYLEVISDYCKSELDKRNIGFDAGQHAVDPVAENFQVWNIAEDGLMITFNEDTVAAYGAGPQVVVVPYHTLEPVVASQGILAGYLP